MTAEDTRAGQPLPDRGFACAAVDRPRGLVGLTQAWPDIQFEDHPDYLLRDHPVAAVGFATLQAYMQRRFGLPYLGGDRGGDVCGGWLLTTPDPAAFLLVRPSLSGPAFSLLPMTLPAGAAPDPDVRRRAARDAVRAAALDLLRPLAVRDSAFNVLGPVPEGSPLLAYEEDPETYEGHYLYRVEAHPATCRSMPRDLVGSARWSRLLGLAHGAGEGDVSRGLDLAIIRLEDKVLQRAARASLGARALLAGIAGLRPNMVEAARLELHDRLRLDGDWRALAAEVTALLGGAEDIEGALAFDDADIAEAASIAGALGYEGDLAGPLRRRAAARLLDAEWDRFAALVGGEIPDAAIPVLGRRRMGYPNTADIQAFFANLREHGKPEAAAWGEAHLASPETAWIAHKAAAHVIVRHAEALRKRDAGMDAPAAEAGEPPDTGRAP